MFLEMDTWKRIRARFSEEEKQLLNGATTGETICPRGCFVDEARLTVTILAKLKGSE